MSTPKKVIKFAPNVKGGIEDKLTAYFKTTYSAITTDSQLVVVRKLIVALILRI